MNAAMAILTGMWDVCGEMAPYLLLGFLIAGILSVVVSPETVERHLGRRGFGQVVKAALIGVPLPLCSCSVLPVSASLRKHGAGKGATVSFLASTPQTGVDSIMVTYGLLGPVFAAARVVVAFASGILGGAVLEMFDRSDDRPPRCEDECCNGGGGRSDSRAKRALRYGFVTLPREIGRAMLLGLLVAAALSALVPHDYFSGLVGPGWGQMLVMLAVGVPMYVCSSGSVPIALALMRMGVTPGAALVFLVAGPATNAAAVATVWKVLGRAATAVYLASVSVCALAAGFVIDRVPRSLFPDHSGGMSHEAGAPASFLRGALAALLLALLAPSLLPRRGHGD